MQTNQQLLNFVNGNWHTSSASTNSNITNPATTQVIAKVPMSPGAEVDSAVQAAHAAFQIWRRTPVTERIQPMFKFKATAGFRAHGKRQS